jgi:hypothetical protein
MRRSILLFFLGITSLFSQNTAGSGPTDANARVWYYGTVVLPNTSTAITMPVYGPTGVSPTTVFIDQINLANTTGSSVTVTIVDQSTNCGGGACTIVPAVAVAANTLYTIALRGAPATGGIKWSASVSNAIHGSIRGRY